MEDFDNKQQEAFCDAVLASTPSITDVAGASCNVTDVNPAPSRRRLLAVGIDVIFSLLVQTRAPRPPFLGPSLLLSPLSSRPGSAAPCPQPSHSCTVLFLPAFTALGRCTAHHPTDRFHQPERG